ncbi:glycosyltransferase [Mollicutes bacterium LVI A0039]|nr:glycosyltransferase [Mollicutes bacterium LVI A0039]
MIFVTYGTQPHNFEYLGTVVNAIDSKYQVSVQIGESQNNITRAATSVADYLDNFDQIVEQSDIIITHGGVGSIMAGLKLGKKVIAVSRLAKYGEHVDDHQLEVTTKLASQGHIYHLERDQDINNVLAEVLATEFKPYASNTKNFVENIEKILLGEYND